VVFQKNATLKTVLERLCKNRSNLSVERLTPKDLDGNDLDLNKTLSQLNKTEITFYNEKIFKINLPGGSHESMPYMPTTTLKQALEKVSGKTGISLGAYIPKDLDGNELDLRKTLKQIGKFEINFKDKSPIRKYPKILTIYLPKGQVSGVVFEPEKKLKYVLEKLCSSRTDVTMDKHVAKDMDGNKLDLNKTLGELNQPDIAFRDKKE